ncbi:MAG: L-histidine N(alpha)-methyltransferase [Myxococcota bacterium]
MPRKSQAPSQTVDLFFSIAQALGLEDDRTLAALAGVSQETIANWRSGSVQELKAQKLEAVKRGLRARINALEESAGLRRADPADGLVSLEVEVDSSPVALQRQLRDRVHYDYLGHRFLYFEAPGALAWENLIATGYEQDYWLQGVGECASAWLDNARDARGQCRGPLAKALGFTRRAKARGLDVISLGPGEGGKEVLILESILGLQKRAEQLLPWLTIALADVSIPLLMKAATATRLQARDQAMVLPVCADFEEGSLRFISRLPTNNTDPEDGLRLVLILGNVFGNLRDEEAFVKHRLARLLRKGDRLWIEVGTRPDRIESDPLYDLTRTDRKETAGQANRRLLLEGPYRRWEAAMGRRPSPIDLRVSLREDDDSARVPGSCNFCHDLVFVDERRTCTMLYSRRYQIEGLSKWFERQSFEVERVVHVSDSKRRPRVAHLLLRKR